MYCSQKYLVLPVNYKSKVQRLDFFSDSELIYDLEIRLDEEAPDHEYYLDIERFTGREIELRCTCEIVSEFRQSEKDPHLLKTSGNQADIRPRFHFTAKNGWINDPNGLVFFNGCYHMFYQHNPVGHEWGNMHWGHAVSSDFVHWTEKDIALFPDRMGTIFSGSAIVDTNNVTGLKENHNDVIILFYTAAGGTSELSRDREFTQCIAYSTDGGFTFRSYDRNPVINCITPGNRDPKVIRHKKSGKYVMVLYLESNRYALFTSLDLLKWKQTQEIVLEGDTECPDFYQLALDGDPDKSKWIFSGASDRYLTGDFDGERFQPDHKPKILHFGKSSYAAQTWSDIPDEDGRRIRITWNNTVDFPLQAYNKCMTFPCEMSLKSFGGESFLCAYPVKEIESLYTEGLCRSDISVDAGDVLTYDLNGIFQDIVLTIIDPGMAGVTVSVFGIDIICDPLNGKLICRENTAPFALIDGKAELRILTDTSGAEIYINKGMAFLSEVDLPDTDNKILEIK